MNIKDYINETLREKFDPSKAKKAIDIEKALNNGDFEITGEMEFDLKNLEKNELEQIEDAIRNYFDEDNIDWLEIKRDGTKFKIVETKPEEQKFAEKQEKDDDKENDENKEKDNGGDSEDVGGGLDSDDEEDPEEIEKELIDYFKEQGSDDPEADIIEYLKNMYGDPNDPEFQKELEELEDEENNNSGKKDDNKSKNESLDESVMLTEASMLNRLLTGSLIRSSIRGRLAKNRMAVLKMKIDKETNPKKKKKLQSSYDMISKSNFDRKGRPRAIVFNCRQTLAGVKGVLTGKAKLGEVLKNCTTLGKIVGALQVRRAKKRDPEEFFKARGKAEADAGKQAYKDANDENTDKDANDENTDKVKKDKDGNVLKQEEVTDKSTGKKMKVTTHTGPRGGKFYWPKGAPKNDEHKVYIDKKGNVKENTSFMNLKDYITESMSSAHTSKVFDPSKAKKSIDIENAINNGDFVVTDDIQFQCKYLSDIECEDLEEAIKQYWDDGGIDWMKIERKGNRFNIYTVGSK